MILSDRDIKARLAKGDLKIEPLSDPDLQIQPASVDLRLDRRFILFRSAQVTAIDPKAVPDDLHEEYIAKEGEPFVLHPGDFVLGNTMERVTIPSDLVARVEGRSSLGRLAILVHATAGFIDPGFEGQITLELANLGRVPVLLHPGSRVSQIVLHEMKSPAERPYGPARGSKYQSQMGPTATRVKFDKA
jgi:dCTP deaminase